MANKNSTISLILTQPSLTRILGSLSSWSSSVAVRKKVASAIIVHSQPKSFAETVAHTSATKSSMVKKNVVRTSGTATIAIKAKSPAKPQSSRKQN